MLEDKIIVQDRGFDAGLAAFLDEVDVTIEYSKSNE